MNATDDGDEPVGEAPEMTMPRVASLVDRQAQALRQASRQMEMFLQDGERNRIIVALAEIDRLLRLA